MGSLVIIGSGPSGVHFALSALRKAHKVVMLDVGIPGPEPVSPERTFFGLKESLPDPVEYFLGSGFEAVLYPDDRNEYYGFPPSKSHVFQKPPSYHVEAHGFAPLASFARGGLAEAWTAGVYPFNEQEMKDFPIPYPSMAKAYDEVARRIGISGTKDDLAQFMPLQDHMMEPLGLDDHGRDLLVRYEKKKDHLNRKVGCYIGRARTAALSRPGRSRKDCAYCGRCLWGCPNGAFYTPSLTLRECQAYEDFQYIPGVYVSHFTFDAQRRVTHVIGKSSNGNVLHNFGVDHLVLAAGTLSTSRIFLESLGRGASGTVRLQGLMDNQQIMVPFVNPRLIGKAYSPNSYQYHQIVMGFPGESTKEYVHGLVTTLKTALVHPLIQKMPCDLRTAIGLFRNMRAGLGLVNVNLHDTRRPDCFLELDARKTEAEGRLRAQYVPDPDTPVRVKKAVARVKRALRDLGCFVPPGMVHVRPAGASVHYAGTLPMSAERQPLTVSSLCQSHDFDNLYIVDGSTFPFLPAKNITFSLMANAVRVADAVL